MVAPEEKLSNHHILEMAIHLTSRDILLKATNVILVLELGEKPNKNHECL